VNNQILRLFGVIVVMFALLIVWTTRWTVIDATALDDNPLNTRTLLADLKIERGRIIADDGEVLARSLPAGNGDWRRTYPGGPLFAQAVGYDNLVEHSSAGLEKSRAGDLKGSPTDISSVFGPLGGGQQYGDDVHTTLDPRAQAVARAALAGRAGSVVALDPRTGAVLVMYSDPSYDDNDPTPDAACIADSCQLDRATEGQYPPGSTFKIVTATAAIDSGRFTPDSVVNGDSPVRISGVPLSNDLDQSFGPITLTTALTYSVNTVWAQVAERLGIATMTEYMKRFGFYSRPPLDIPGDEVYPSGPHSFRTGRAFAPGSDLEDIGRIAIGQGGLEVTPLQMAMVAAAVANRGRLMVPHLTATIVDPVGRTVQTIEPKLYRRVMKPSTAAEIAQMMKNVVDEGTGTPAQLGHGIPFAGKTGTASVGPAGADLTQPWFIGFAPVGDPKVAIAVTIQRTDGGYGGQVAAPIAKDVVQTLLAEGR
jgi:peptidoglycan glycosyltransferase